MPKSSWPVPKRKPRAAHILEPWQYATIRRVMQQTVHGQRTRTISELAVRYDLSERSIQRIVAGQQGTRSVDSWGL